MWVPNVKITNRALPLNALKPWWLKDFSVLFLFYFRWRCVCFANRKCNPQWYRPLCLWSQYRSSVKIVSQIVCFDWYIGSTSTSSCVRWTHVCIFYLIRFFIYWTLVSVISICKCQYQYLVLKTIFDSNQILKYYSLLHVCSTVNLVLEFLIWTYKSTNDMYFTDFQIYLI